MVNRYYFFDSQCRCWYLGKQGGRCTGAGHIIRISSKSWFISLIPFKWNLYNVYIHSTQTDLFQVFISFNFDDYNWQLMKTPNSVSQKIRILWKGSILSTLEPCLGYKLLHITNLFTYVITSGGPLSALTCCVNVRLLSGDKKNIAVNLFSKLGWELGLYYASYDDFHPDILARMYT